MYAGAAAAVLTWRLGLPALRTFRHQISVLSVEREGPDVVSVHLGGRDLHRLGAKAGQFLIWRFLDGDGWSRAHPYSLSAAPRGNRLRITVKGAQESARLAALRPGTWAQVEGPYGRLTGECRTGDRVAMFAAGIGVTPLRALLEDLAYGPGDAVLIYRAHCAADLVFSGELDELAARRGITVHYLVGPRAPAGPTWLPAGLDLGDDPAAMRALVPDLTDHDVYVCGPAGWLDAVTAAATAAGVPHARLHTERFSW